jgi:diacylglycerol kinase family enzyme
MVVLPGGTRCHFARDLGLDPARIVDSLAGFGGVQRRIDVGLINGRVFLNNASFGLYADIVSRPDYREHKLRVARQVLTAHARGKRQDYQLAFRRGQKRFHHVVQLLVGVGPYDTLHVFELGQRQRLDAGVLQVTAVTRLDDALVRQLLKTMSLDQLHGARLGNGIEQWATRELTVASPDGGVRVGVDGEFEEYDSPVHVSIRPKALQIYVPAEGERGRAKRALDPALLQRTWRVAATGHD